MVTDLKKNVLVLALVSLFFIFSGSRSFAVEQYDDVSSEMVGYSEIQYLTNKDIIKGYPDGEFHPGENVSRVEAAIMLTRSLDLSTNNRPDVDLKDVAKDHPRYDYIAAVVDERIFQGTTSNEFQPNKDIQRVEMAAVLKRAFELDIGPVETDFRDVADDRNYVTEVASNRISVGFPDQTFRPYEETTRSQFSIFLARTMDKSFRNPTINSSFLDTASNGSIESCFVPINQTTTLNEMTYSHGHPEKETSWGGEIKADYGKCSYLFYSEEPNQMRGIIYYPMDDRLTTEKVIGKLGDNPDEQTWKNGTWQQLYYIDHYTVSFVYPDKESSLQYIYLKPTDYVDTTWLLNEKYFNDMTWKNGNPTIANPTNQLALVNKEHYLPSWYTPELVRPDVSFVFGDQELNKAYMRPEAARHLERLFEAAERDGINILATSGYRSYERQQTLFQQEVEESGREQAKQVVAIPGTSEHQTGLSMDITSASVDYHLVQRFGNTEEGKWLENNAYKYGFILRYPEGKQEVTGYQYEPWHFRYVGERYARIIHQNNITLEEYFNSVTKY